MATTYEEMTDELTNYYNTFNKNIIFNDMESNFNNKIDESDQKETLYNNNYEDNTCYSCTYFALHSDIYDIGKLLSNKLLLEKGFLKLSNINKLKITKLINQIDQHIETLIMDDKIANIKYKEVNEHIIIDKYFNDYFENKYTMYKILGVI